MEEPNSYESANNKNFKFHLTLLTINLACLAIVIAISNISSCQKGNVGNFLIMSIIITIIDFSITKIRTYTRILSIILTIIIAFYTVLISTNKFRNLTSSIDNFFCNSTVTIIPDSTVIDLDSIPTDSTFIPQDTIIIFDSTPQKQKPDQYEIIPPPEIVKPTSIDSEIFLNSFDNINPNVSIKYSDIKDMIDDKGRKIEYSYLANPIMASVSYYSDSKKLIIITTDNKYYKEIK